MAGGAGDGAGNPLQYECAEVVSPPAIRDRMFERQKAGKFDGRSP